MFCIVTDFMCLVILLDSMQHSYHFVMATLINSSQK